MKIYIALPAHHPNDYLKDGCRTSWNQITHFVYKAVYAKFPNNTQYTYWENKPQTTKEDILISALPNTLLQRYPERSIIVDNDNFDVDKWKYGKFNKYGINGDVPSSFPFNDCLKNLYGALYKTNDVAIAKWNNNDPEVLEKKQFLQENIKHIELLQHPMDKAYFSSFYNPNKIPATLKMLIYDGPDRKSAKQLISIIDKYNIPRSSIGIINGLRKTEANVRNILNEYAYFSQPSYSEGFPYFANEFLCQGLPLLGNEEWWEPYGKDILKYSCNPEKHEQIANNIKTLLSNDFKEEYISLRKHVVETHLARTDNNWDYLTNKLINLIESLL